jgi:hypothetical protein
MSEKEGGFQSSEVFEVALKTSGMPDMLIETTRLE